MDDPIDLRVSTTGRVHPNNEVLRIAPCMCRAGEKYRKIDMFWTLKVNELDKIVMIPKKKNVVISLWFPLLQIIDRRLKKTYKYL